MGDQINVEIKASIGVRDVAMPYVAHFLMIETCQQEVQANGIRFECPISHEVSEANQRELCAVFNAILRDAYDEMVRGAAAEGKKPDDISDLLKRLNLEAHEKKFKDEGIDLAAARKLTDEHLQELGLNYSERSSLLSALQSSASSGPTVVIENGKLNAWLPFVCVRVLEQMFPFFDLYNAALKVGLAVSPASQGGLEAILSARGSRNALHEIAEKVETPQDKSLVRSMGLLQNLSLRLDMFDLLALIKELEISRMVNENERVQELSQVVPKAQAAILDMFEFTKNQWANGEPRWFALLKLIHRDIFGHHARVTGELTIAKTVCIKFAADDIDCALQLYPPAARDITAPAPGSAHTPAAATKSKQVQKRR